MVVVSQVLSLPLVCRVTAYWSWLGWSILRPSGSYGSMGLEKNVLPSTGSQVADGESDHKVIARPLDMKVSCEYIE